MSASELPLPPHVDPAAVGAVWRVPCEERAAEAAAWAARYGITPAHGDARRLVLLAVDVQNTFCIPDFELYVGGRSGTGAVDDTRRLAAFIYRNLARLSGIVATLDTHRIYHVFHAPFLVDADGRHPAPYTMVSAEDVAAGRWRFDAAAAPALGITPEEGQRHLEHYVAALGVSGKYALTVWPYHSMLGGIGHALVSAFEEAMFFHAIARASQPLLHQKGSHALTEHFSALGPEVATDAAGRPLEPDDTTILDQLAACDAMIIAGQAKSHCVAWTVADLIAAAERRDAALVRRIYLLEDCSSAVVVPGVVDFTDAADAAYARFAAAGVHVVRSTTPVAEWPGPVSA